MEPTALSYQIRKLMPYGQKFTHDGMFSLYLQVMNLDEFCGLKKMKRKSFERTLRAWISLDGSWLIKDGIGEKAVYFKRGPEPIQWYDMTLKGIYSWMNLSKDGSLKKPLITAKKKYLKL